MPKYFNDRHVDIGFSRKLNVFVSSCVKRLGTSGFKFPAKGSLPVILSSMYKAEYLDKERSYKNSTKEVILLFYLIFPIQPSKCWTKFRFINTLMSCCVHSIGYKQ